jgi:hypothetical protein
MDGIVESVVGAYPETGFSGYMIAEITLGIRK